MTGQCTLVEVGPRDGFQPIAPLIPTDRKIDMIRRLHAAGLRRIEATAFVSDRAIPQLADGPAVLAAARELDGLDVQVLVPNQRYCDIAIAAGADHIAFVLSVSERHNINNVRRTPAESIAEYRRLAVALPPRVRVRVNVATAFDCPFGGEVEPAAVLDIVDALLAIRPDVEIALCDTTGRVTPDRVAALFAEAATRFRRGPSWAYHGHDTYGLGVANAIAAFKVGVRVFDASFGGLGGCPFAPGATGNVATEDMAWTFERMGIATGIDLAALLPVAADAAALPGASAGGRVREALRGTMDRGVGVAA